MCRFLYLYAYLKCAYLKFLFHLKTRRYLPNDLIYFTTNISLNYCLPDLSIYTYRIYDVRMINDFSRGFFFKYII